MMKGATEESRDPSSPVQKHNPRTRFTEKILKTIIGSERANQALQSLSMGIIPGAHNSAFNIGSKCHFSHQETAVAHLGATH